MAHVAMIALFIRGVRLPPLRTGNFIVGFVYDASIKWHDKGSI